MPWSRLVLLPDAALLSDVTQLIRRHRNVKCPPPGGSDYDVILIMGLLGRDCFSSVKDGGGSTVVMSLGGRG